ncbi:TPA: ABC transporter substrate-binding protein [Aeromonas hydrophila]|nr:ABC transporter substrate-binding protein [Aeromonas hydrophila]
MWRFFSIFYFSLAGLNAQESEIRVWNQMLDHPSPIVMRVFLRALELTEPEYGSFQLIRSRSMEQGRAIRALEVGGLDIAVFAPDAKREQTLLSIPFPIEKGLLGWRVCLIRSDRIAPFYKISSLSGWKKSGLTIGQLTTWPDTNVLRSNGLKLELTPIYESLFKMLRKGRFDCFLRSVIEVEDEVKKHPDLIIEKNILFRYPLPLLYFVSPANPKLAERVQLGLSRVKASGEYEKIFKESLKNNSVMSTIGKRRVIDIENNDLSPILKRSLLESDFKYSFSTRD